eukprot:TRINITY_DN1674_c0_g1_i8.p4 TRINITY_DN1674_c0_g1~~TRINITY_DN1674_c0_g1_i8.p4  ORF type:complete len:103 (-),score=39.28 TRINITY_DN1674_c0_g1_i8:695-1003(-)
MGAAATGTAAAAAAALPAADGPAAALLLLTGALMAAAVGEEAATALLLPSNWAGSSRDVGGTGWKSATLMRGNRKPWRRTREYDFCVSSGRTRPAVNYNIKS